MMTMNDGLSHAQLEQWTAAAVSLADALGKLDQNLGGTNNSSQASIHAGGVTNGIALGAAIGAVVFVVLAIVGGMLAFQSLRSELIADQKASLEREQAWLSVWSAKVESVRAELRAEREKQP
jgi:hypothetical protein